MIRLSVNVIWSSQALLKTISEYNIRSTEDIYLRNSGQISIDVLIELAMKCHWISIEKEMFVVSEHGRAILNEQEFSDRAKLILSDYVCYVAPAWARRIPYGRQEAFIFMSKDEQACFFEAGLMEDNPSSEVIRWWDNISCYLRKVQEESKTEIGRKGEYFTVLYEQRRTGKKPQWIALDSNLSGYDVMSQCSEGDNTSLLIEVKSSERSIYSADFLLSANEWHTACYTDNYAFYIWCFFEGRNQLAVVWPEQLKCYIPTNNNTGEWQMVRIPFANFAEKFNEITMEGDGNG